MGFVYFCFSSVCVCNKKKENIPQNCPSKSFVSFSIGLWHNRVAVHREKLCPSSHSWGEASCLSSLSGSKQNALWQVNQHPGSWPTSSLFLSCSRTSPVAWGDTALLLYIRSGQTQSSSASESLWPLASLLICCNHSCLSWAPHSEAFS